MREDSKDADDDAGANVAAAALEDLKGSEGGEGRDMDGDKHDDARHQLMQQHHVIRSARSGGAARSIRT